MITVDDLREHVLTAAEAYDLPITIRQADDLTDHQMAVLVGLASGEDAKQTGRRICRSENTVKTHRRTLYAALGAHSGAQAVAIAIGLGLLSVPQTEVDAR